MAFYFAAKLLFLFFPPESVTSVSLFFVELSSRFVLFFLAIKMVAESWFQTLWRTSKKDEISSEKVLGVLAFEVAGLMSKLVQLWQSLADKQVNKVREEITNSLGIRKLVSDDDDFIVKLICAEMMENLGNVARTVARLSKKCRDPLLKNFESAYNDLIKIGVDPCGWQYPWKKMDRKVKKMEKFILVNSNLYQEMETLGGLEQTLKRMKSYDDADAISLVEYEKKVAWKHQEVKHLKEISLWNRTYDYTIELLAGSVFTIFGRIGHVFGINHLIETGSKDSSVTDSDHIRRSHSVVFMQSSVHPSEAAISRFSSGPLGSRITKSGPILMRNNLDNFHSGPLQNPTMGSSPISERKSIVNFYSGPLGRSNPKSSPMNKSNKVGMRFWRFWSYSSNKQRRGSHSQPSLLTSNELGGRCITGEDGSSVSCYLKPTSSNSGTRDRRKDVKAEPLYSPDKFHYPQSVHCSNSKLLDAPPESLGAAGLALHYANVIIVIEKLAASPHLIGQDARDDLYNMLPASIRTALRAKLKPFAKTLTSSIYDAVLAGEWTEAISAMLEWLAPLAHNMIRWQSERSFEHQNLVSRTYVLLVQTLYFANQEKTEAVITEMLVGLNYIWRFGREINVKSLAECASGRTIDEYLDGQQ